MGKHSKSKSHGVRNTAILVGTPAVLTLGGFEAAHAATPTGTWDVIAQCESDNKNVENGTSTASGYFQIINGTWVGNGGLEFAPRAIQATRAEQLIVAQRIAARRGSLADWNESKSCWGKKISSSVPQAERPQTQTKKPQATQGSRHAKPPTGKKYVVKKGDTLSKIAAMNGKDWRKLASNNRSTIANPNLIFVGQSIII